MSKNIFCYRPRFKGIENLLRRVAFNLGNSPSQTEVKIISCVPIDVTDLQSKILELEKELDERTADQNAMYMTKEPVGVNTVLTGAPIQIPADPPPDQRPSTSSKTHSSQRSSADIPSSAPADEQPSTSYAYKVPGKETAKQEKSEGLLQKVKRLGKKKPNNRTHMVYYTETRSNSPFNNKELPDSNYRRQDNELIMDNICLSDVMHRQYQPEQLGPNTSSSRFSSPVCRDEPYGPPLPRLDTDMCSCCHGHFRDLDATVRDPGYFPADSLPPDRLANYNHSMYYDSNLYDVIPVRERSTNMKKDENMYEIREETHEQQFDYSNLRSGLRNQSYVINGPRNQPYVVNGPQNQSNVVDGSRNQPYVLNGPRNQSYIVNYATTGLYPVRYNHKNPHNKRNLPRKSFHRREQVLKAMQKRKLDKQMNEDSSFSCAVECGKVYKKSKPKSRTLKARAPIPPVLLKNAECLTMILADSECQTTTSRSVQLEPPPPEENKTEITLNQIKSILHAVLTEVKTNSQRKEVEDKPKKDGVAQKGSSQSNMAARSSVLNGHPCSAYNTNPYGTQCSYSTPVTGSQLYPPIHGTVTQAAVPLSPPGPYTYPQHRCFHNYPLFIHTTGRQYACCYGSNMPTAPRSPTVTLAHAAHTNNIKPNNAANTSTNTDKREPQRNKQTDKLIKEIYKSLAVNMNYPKETSHSDSLAVSSSPTTQQKFEFKLKPKAKETSATESSEVKSAGVQGSLPSTPVNKRTFESRGQSDDANFRTELVSKMTTPTASGAGSRLEAERLRGLLATRDLLLSASNTSSMLPTQSQRRRQLYMMPDVPNVFYRGESDDESETSSTESVESDVTVVEKKEGLLSKMKKLFTTKHKRRRRRNTSSVPDETASDSDEYETVYSQQIQRVDKRGRPMVSFREPEYAAPPAPRARRPQSKLSRSHASHTREKRDKRTKSPRPRNSPYMEQEYRRYWDEKLMFHSGDTPRYSSERPMSRETRGRRHAPAYWREYAAHAALVDQPKPTPAPSPRHEQTTQHDAQEKRPAEKEIVAKPKAIDSAKSKPWYKKLRCAPDWKQIILDG